MQRNVCRRGAASRPAAARERRVTQRARQNGDGLRVRRRWRRRRSGIAACVGGREPPSHAPFACESNSLARVARPPTTRVARPPTTTRITRRDSLARVARRRSSSGEGDVARPERPPLHPNSRGIRDDDAHPPSRAPPRVQPTARPRDDDDPRLPKRLCEGVDVLMDLVRVAKRGVDERVERRDLPHQQQRGTSGQASRNTSKGTAHSMPGARRDTPAARSSSARRRVAGAAR